MEEKQIVKIKPAMHHAVTSSLKCAVDMIENRKGSFDMYGYDFVLDEDLNTWLLEINASPSMEHSTPVTARLCPQGLEDVLKVVVDVPKELDRRAAAGEPRDVTAPDLDCGKWRLICRDPSCVPAPAYCGLELTVKGEACKMSKKKKKKKKKASDAASEEASTAGDGDGEDAMDDDATTPSDNFVLINGRRASM